MGPRAWEGGVSKSMADRLAEARDGLKGQRRLAEGNVMKRPVIRWADGGEG